MSRGPVIVFAGPSLPAEERARLSARFGPELIWHPPAARGDALRALHHQPRALVLVDGYFHARPAIPHKELLYVLDVGVRVIGAASLGALRAVELEPLGMEGVGTVVRWYREGRIEGDDEVAVLHEPAERDHRSTTRALVEIRRVLDVLVRARSIGRDQADALASAVASLPYVGRREEVVEALAGQHLGTAGELLARRLGKTGLKTRDARRGVRRAFEGAPSTKPGGERHTETRYLAYYREWSLGIETSLGGTSPPQATLGDAFRLAQLFHPEMPVWWDALRREFLLASAARASPTAAQEAKANQLAVDRRVRQLRQALTNPAALPPPELEAEARRIVKARSAVERHGGVDAALTALAESHALGSRTTTDEDAMASAVALLDHLSRVQLDAIPVWVAIRAFATSPALAPALDLAHRVARIRHAFRATTGRQRIAKHEGNRLAAELWGCSADDVADQAARRGLYPGDGYSPGLHDVLADVLPAERLGQPIEDYETAKTALLRAPLTHPLRTEQ